jgi:hypothetical protein
MALSDILTVPFLVSLGITLLLVGLLGMFFVQRLQEQNHKMASMLGLVSTMAEELNFIRGRLQMMSYVPQANGGGTPISQQQQTFSQNVDADNLIPVSDGENESDDDSEENDSDDNDSDSEENEDSSEDDNDDEESSVLEFIAPIENIIELNTSNPSLQTVKIINFGDLITSQSENIEENVEDLDEMHDIDADDLDDLDDIENLDDCDSDIGSGSDSDNENNKVQEEVATELTEKATKENLSFIKSIDISNLEEPVDSGSIDYKKMSMTKLKSIAVAKGLIQENSKATKNAILKLLASE